MLYIIITLEIFLLFQNCELYEVKISKGIWVSIFPSRISFNLNNLHVHTEGFHSVILMPAAKRSGYGTELISRDHSSVITTGPWWHSKEIKSKGNNVWLVSTVWLFTGSSFYSPCLRSVQVFPHLYVPGWHLTVIINYVLMQLLLHSFLPADTVQKRLFRATSISKRFK